MSFLSGAILSGFVIGQTSLTLGRRYGRALYFEAALLIAAYWSYQQHDYLGQLAAAMACGLQNAMVATYSGAVIRTTHLTGLTSDMGAAIGNWLAGRSISKPTLGFQAVIWYCFCGGSTIGAFCLPKLAMMRCLYPSQSF
nr:YoaK family protein [Psychrobacter sp. KH172YL61]